MIGALLLAALVATGPGLAGEARAEWRRTADLNYNTAFTLEQGAVEIGIMTPFTVGATDDVQVAIHPILLLLGQPYLALRWRLTQEQDVTVALNAGGTWSFIRREDAEGAPASAAADGEPVGFPGTVQLVATTTFRVGDAVLLSVGVGPAVDFLGDAAIRGLAEGHASAHWLIDSDKLLMLQATGYVQLSGDVRLRRPALQLIYAASLSRSVHIALGVGVGDFLLDTGAEDRRTIDVFPVIDLWFRL